MANILLGVTGSVAAIRTPRLFDEFQGLGHSVKVVSTRTATHFFDVNTLGSQTGTRNPNLVILDEDEWPETRYSRNDPVLHIELRRWADLFLVAPLDANTLAKLANGISDNCLTCVWRAWDLQKPVVLAPAMNTFMWEHPLTANHLNQLAVLAGCSSDKLMSLEDTMTRITTESRWLKFIPPISKVLACGDFGVGAMAEVSTIVDAVISILATTNSAS